MGEANTLISRAGVLYPWHWLTREWLRPRIARDTGVSVASVRRLTIAIDSLWPDASIPRACFIFPLVTLGDWRLAAGDVQGADSLATRVRALAMVDSMAMIRSHAASGMA